MSTEICEQCARDGTKLYRCSKCQVNLCRHSVRSHVCSKAYTEFRVREKISKEAADVSETYWEKFLKNNKKFEVRVKADLTIFVDFPYYPFTLLNAWIPARRGQYKNERRQSDLNVENFFTSMEKESQPHQYDRKFYYEHWARDSFRSWQRNWKKLNGYWEKRSNQRPTKFLLHFPQLALEDLKILKSHGCKIIFEKGANEKLEKAKEKVYSTFNVNIDFLESNLRIRWSKGFSQWFHTLFKDFARYLAIRTEDDPDADYIPCITQVGEREIHIASWASFRANYFWKIAKKELMKPYLFKIFYKPYESPLEKEDLDTKPTYTLREYQNKAIEEWEASDYFGTIELPTGSGKTIIGIETIHRTRERTLILVPNLALVDQWIHQLSGKLSIPVEKIGIFNGQKKEFRHHSVVISTYQLLSQYLQDFRAYETANQEEGIRRDKILVEDTIGFFTTKFGLLIADEAHHIQAQTFRQIAMELQIARRVALSATIEKSLHSSLVIATMGPIVYRVHYGLLARGGFIAPIYSKRIFIPLTDQEKEMLQNQKKGTNIAGKISREAKNKFRVIYNLMKSETTSQTLIFTSRIKHANEIHSFLKGNGIESTVLTGNTVTNDSELQTLLENFRKGIIRILVLVLMLNEGFDAPADTVIIASGTRNRREQIQRLGRATRPGKIAKFFELVVDPSELEYEFEVAKERDVSDVIEPWVQESLIPPETKKDLDRLIERIVAGLKETDADELSLIDDSQSKDSLSLT
ncbi:MAG: DEAD/DEAH box helicase [Candidatus Odinarchaeota archaeon]